MTQEHGHHHHHHHHHHHEQPAEESAAVAAPAPAAKAAAPKLPLSVRKSIRDQFDPYVPEWQSDMEQYLGVPWTLDVPWEMLVHENKMRGMSENPGTWVANIFKNTVYQIKNLTKEGKDKATVDALNSNASAHVVSIALDASVSPCGSKVENGTLWLLFKDGDNIGMNSAYTLEDLPKKLNAGGTLSLLVRKSIRDEFDPYVPEFTKKTENLFGAPWSMEVPWEMLMSQNKQRGFETHPGDWMKSIMEGMLYQLNRMTSDGKDAMAIQAINATITTKTVTIDLDESIPRWCGCKVDNGKLVLLFKGGENLGSNKNETLDKFQDMLAPSSGDEPEAKYPLAVRKNIRDNWVPYQATFEEETKKLFGEPWTAEPNFALILTQENKNFMSHPGATTKAIFAAAIQQLKRLTKDGKDDMFVEGLQEAVSEKIVTIDVDDSIKGFSYCKLEDGKLILLFKKNDYFGSNVNDTLRDLEKML